MAATVGTIIPKILCVFNNAAVQKYAAAARAAPNR